MNGHISNTLSVQTGVPQESVLGPLLFVMFTNDLIAPENRYLFADNCLRLLADPDISTKSKRKSIELPSNWYSKNCLV